MSRPQNRKKASMLLIHECIFLQYKYLWCSYIYRHYYIYCICFNQPFFIENFWNKQLCILIFFLKMFVIFLKFSSFIMLFTYAQVYNVTENSYLHPHIITYFITRKVAKVFMLVLLGCLFKKNVWKFFSLGLYKFWISKQAVTHFLYFHSF